LPDKPAAPDTKRKAEAGLIAAAIAAIRVHTAKGLFDIFEPKLHFSRLGGAMATIARVAVLWSLALCTSASAETQLNRHVERVFDTSRKDHHWGRRKLARNQ
jgi:hypothetical protein